MFRIFFVFIVFITTSYAKTIFIEGIDNKFMCDGKQSSGGGFQKCGKITALKPMRLCYSTPSGVKCKKLEANQTLDTETDTITSDETNNDKKRQKKATNSKNEDKSSYKKPQNTINTDNQKNENFVEDDNPKRDTNSSNTNGSSGNDDNQSSGTNSSGNSDSSSGGGNSSRSSDSSSGGGSSSGSGDSSSSSGSSSGSGDSSSSSGSSSGGGDSSSSSGSSSGGGDSSSSSGSSSGSGNGSSGSGSSIDLANLFNLDGVNASDVGASMNEDRYRIYAPFSMYKISFEGSNIEKSLYDLSDEKNITKGSSSSDSEYIYTDNPYMYNDMSWGYWSELVDPDVSLFDTNKYYFVGGIKTPSSEIDKLLNAKSVQKFTFNGRVMGSVLTNSIVEEINDTTSSLQMAFDLGGGVNSMTGTMSFETNSTSWDVNLNSNHSQISNTGFSGDITSNITSINSGSFQGQFYGEDKLRGVGGTFEIQDNLNNKAIGAFKAFRDDIDTKIENLEKSPSITNPNPIGGPALY